MIKGFIEVTNTRTNDKTLINVKWIEEIEGNTIYLAVTPPNYVEQVFIDCKETYEEIKKKIEEAVG